MRKRVTRGREETGNGMKEERKGREGKRKRRKDGEMEEDRDGR